MRYNAFESNLELSLFDYMYMNGPLNTFGFKFYFVACPAILFY